MYLIFYTVVTKLYNTTDVVWAAIVMWKFPDGILRINNRPDQPFLNLIQHSPFDMVSVQIEVYYIQIY